MRDIHLYLTTLYHGYVTLSCLQELDASTANHFLVLFRDIIGFKFRALYSYTPDTDHVSANTQHIVTAWQ